MTNEHDKAPGDIGDFAGDTFLRLNWQTAVARALAPRNAYLTALNGKLVGRTFRIGTGRLLLGRAPDCDLVLDDDGVSRRHALFVASAGAKVVLEDLSSTNGTLVNGEFSTLRELDGGERLQFGSETVFKFEFLDSLEENFATYLYESATQDRLTGVFNERYLRDQLRMEFAHHVRHQLPLALIFLDIDKFKSINDTHGHLAGDDVLKQVALRCQAVTRTEDIFARYGGEEFACLLRQTPLDAALTMAERMRAAVADTAFYLRSRQAAQPLRLTISAGVAQLDLSVDAPEALLAEADRQLYAAKDAGRNRVMPAPGGG